MLNRFVCIHGHFYQPPRENPWLGEIEMQPTAAPWHNWNERIADECYLPNAAALNNYARISFDFGPTLLHWLDRSRPEIVEVLLEADYQGGERYSGHGPALAHAYNHIIQPLAGARDKYTQILWGIRDFKHRFNREPEGLWLPETAVDIENLEFLCEMGIRFTILAPHQAEAVQSLDEDRWRPVTSEGFKAVDPIDTTMPYLVRLPSGGEISVFFYDHELSNAVSFGGLLADRDEFVRRLVGNAGVETANGDRPRLSHLATDGETFGHHFKGGEKVLAHAIDAIKAGGEAQLTVYGEFLERFPPVEEVRVAENTSWSCPHGVERWRSDCGCTGGRLEEGSQAWRTPLRDALLWLRDEVADRYERKAGEFITDPWDARNDYIDVLLDPSEENILGFLEGRTLPGRGVDEARQVLPLLEMQKHSMFMFTSCGWFFDDIGDIETIQILLYAGRVIQLAESYMGVDFEHDFLTALKEAESNDPDKGNGREIFERFVRPNMERFPEGQS